MRAPRLLFIAGLVASCSPEAREAEVSSELVSCPPVPPSVPAISIFDASPKVLGAGEVVTITGSGFDKLPPTTVAWFFSNTSGFTATSQLFVLDPTRARAVVPSSLLIAGDGFVSLYYTQCVDCPAGQGGPNSCAGNWVVSGAPMPQVKFTHPAPRPLP